MRLDNLHGEKKFIFLPLLSVCLSMSLSLCARICVSDYSSSSRGRWDLVILVLFTLLYQLQSSFKNTDWLFLI